MSEKLSRLRSKMVSRLSIAAKERWRKRKATMEVSQVECILKEDQNIQMASLASQNEVAEGLSPSALTTDNEQNKGSQSAAFISKRKVSKVNNMFVRRSNRLRSSQLFGKRQGKEAVQHIDLTECDRGKEQHVEPISLKPIRGASSSEIEVDYPVHTADGPKNSALTNAQSKLSQAFSSKRKALKANNMIVRQPDQLKSLGSFGERQGREGVHHVDSADCDRDTELHVEPICPEPIRNMSSSEMIVDHLVQTRGIRPFASETTATNLNYKILYTDSVKKIEALTEKNYQQAQELYYMLGKVKIYENMIAKDMVAFSNGWRPTGGATNLCHGTVQHHPDAPTLNSACPPKPSPVKRKYSVKRMKKN
ncbi:uncharacterized protein LOC129881750 isoform X2 [Solanum dulcamara]|uniref:uncharacterized protein LOC129881750 isoform X2 n=1 Tax=Solanum dulcamara TaxID=45834 RepID=UPI00248622D9|nr:uncharacterized protein LOC129881750 isoform X2 [Solanum dulcamara]